MIARGRRVQGDVGSASDPPPPRAHTHAQARGQAQARGRRRTRRCGTDSDGPRILERGVDDSLDLR